MNKKTIIASGVISTILFVLANPANLHAQEGDAADLLSIIAAVEQGWQQADGTPFREHYLDFDGARYIESGGQNVGLRNLIEHHVKPEGDALDSLELEFSNIDTHIEGDFAWAIADVEVEAVIKRDKREIHNRGFETFLFRRIDGKWLIIHTHSSSRPVGNQ
ncbi:MAG: YybH family protein [Woeseia sp.]